MAEILLVRSGESADPVARRVEIGVKELEASVGDRTLHYLGAELPPIGETNRVSDFSSPDHVVLSVGGNETGELGLAEQGFYLVEGLSPAEFMPVW